MTGPNPGGAGGGGGGAAPSGPASAYFGLAQPYRGSLAGMFGLSQAQQNPATIKALWAPNGSADQHQVGFEGGGYTMGGGGLAYGSKRGNEMFAPLSPLAMSLRQIENDPSGQGMQAYKTSLMGAGINPYAHSEAQHIGFGSGRPGYANNMAQQQNMQERGRQVFDVTKNFVAGYQQPGLPNFYQQQLQQRQQQGSANPSGDFGHFHSFLQNFLGG